MAVLTAVAVTTMMGGHSTLQHPPDRQQTIIAIATLLVVAHQVVTIIDTWCVIRRSVVALTRMKTLALATTTTSMATGTLMVGTTGMDEEVAVTMEALIMVTRITRPREVASQEAVTAIIHTIQTLLV